MADCPKCIELIQKYNRHVRDADPHRALKALVEYDKHQMQSHLRGPKRPTPA